MTLEELLEELPSPDSLGEVSQYEVVVRGSEVHRSVDNNLSLYKVECDHYNKQIILETEL